MYIYIYVYLYTCIHVYSRKTYLGRLERLHCDLTRILVNEGQMALIRISESLNLPVYIYIFIYKYICKCMHIQSFLSVRTPWFIQVEFV